MQAGPDALRRYCPSLSLTVLTCTMGIVIVLLLFAIS